MKINREDVVQSALLLEKYCKEHCKSIYCDCPFNMGKEYEYDCMLSNNGYPINWNLEQYLRNRGIKHEQ